MMRLEKSSYGVKPFFIMIAIVVLTGCVMTDKPTGFDPRTCLDDVPKNVKGLQILSGPRTRESIVSDMQTAYCNGQVLFKRMNEKDKTVRAGKVRFKVRVEYTGEVIFVKVITSDIESSEFLKKVSDMIMDSDFSSWQRDDQDAEFIYPMQFYRWWE